MFALKIPAQLVLIQAISDTGHIQWIAYQSIHLLPMILRVFPLKKLGVRKYFHPKTVIS